jgi:hypothetical protein
MHFLLRMVRQGDALSPLHFNFASECAIRKEHTHTKKGGLELKGPLEHLSILIIYWVYIVDWLF